MILRPTAGPDDWKAFLAKPDLHWKPGRSAMEAAHAWEAVAGMPPEVAAVFPGAELLLAIPEYQVPLPGGDSASQNDVFALLRDPAGLIVCMVEAKRDETFGPTLGEWLAGASNGKLERLVAITAMLGLPPSGLDPRLRYQLFHRAASALLTARRFHATRAVLLVQSFSPQHRWFDDFARFLDLFGVAPAQGVLQPIPVPAEVSFACVWVHSPLTTEEATQ